MIVTPNNIINISDLGDKSHIIDVIIIQIKLVNVLMSPFIAVISIVLSSV